MATLYIREYSQVGRDFNSANIQSGLEDGGTTDQTVTFSSTAPSAAFKSTTTLVALHSDGICSIKFGTAPTATTANRRMAAGVTEYFSVSPGKSLKVAAITNT